MLKIRRNTPLLPCAALAVAFTLGLGIVGPAAADQAIVVAATAPGLTIGQVIEDGAAVRMPEGTNALFLFSSGRTVTVKGPYEGSLDRLSGGKEPQNRLSGLFGAERFAQNELGAARTVGPPKGRSADELPAIDASVPGVWCVAGRASALYPTPSRSGLRHGGAEARRRQAGDDFLGHISRHPAVARGASLERWR